MESLRDSGTTAHSRVENCAVATMKCRWSCYSAWGMNDAEFPNKTWGLLTNKIRKHENIHGSVAVFLPDKPTAITLESSIWREKTVKSKNTRPHYYYITISLISYCSRILVQYRRKIILSSYRRASQSLCRTITSEAQKFSYSFSLFELQQQYECSAKVNSLVSALELEANADA